MAGILCLGLVAFATGKNYSKIDQSSNVYFDNYARSILESLPKESLLIINYDQQWTSVRYLQECEGVRPDVTSLNLSMMSFKWWEKKHELYPRMKFPGTHYTKPNTVTWKVSERSERALMKTSILR